MRREPLLLLCCCAALLLWAGCAELKNQVPNPVASRTSVHPPGWTDTLSGNFHGLALKARGYDPAACASCHGSGFTGGTSGVACFTCHPAVPHQARFAQSGGHTGYLKGRLFPLGECKSCHGASYAGGTRVPVSCMQSGCHVDRAGTPKSPEACNTCHGAFASLASDTLSFAPPRTIAGDTTAAARGVGAHRVHLRGAGAVSAVAVPCAGCHAVPGSVFAAGHMDTPPPADVAITSALARTPSGGVTPAPAYDAGTLTCANTYCHGNFHILKRNAPTAYQFVFSADTMTGANASPAWNGGPGAVGCGSCHGIPPAGHNNFAPLSGCGDCHLGVVTNQLQILDKDKHMNGKINVFGVELGY